MFKKQNDSLEPIRSSQALADLCGRLAGEDFITVDTEFLRDSTYWPKLCLIQVAGAREEALIDPLDEGMSLQPFYDLLANERVMKVFHAARQDIEIFYQRTGKVPAPLFDSQIGAAVVGLGEAVSYENLVQAMLRRQVDKSSRFTDWAQRPLSESQRRYALADVTYLRDIYPKLRDRIERLDRLHWMQEPMAVLCSPDTYALNPDDAWKRLKLRKTTKPYLAALKQAAAWREREAQERDQPRQRILKDDVLYELAARQPKTLDELGAMRGVPQGLSKGTRGEALLGALKSAYEDPAGIAPDIGPRKPPPAQNINNVTGFLKLLLQLSADRHQVAARLIATTADLERLASEQAHDDPLLCGWRADVFGREAMRLIEGRLALRLQGNDVITTEIS